MQHVSGDNWAQVSVGGVREWDSPEVALSLVAAGKLGGRYGVFHAVQIHPEAVNVVSAPARHMVVKHGRSRAHYVRLGDGRICPVDYAKGEENSG